MLRESGRRSNPQPMSQVQRFTAIPTTTARSGCCWCCQGMRPPAISQLVNVTQSVMPTYMPTMTAPTTYPTMLTPASGTTVVSTAATYQQQAAMLAALQLQQLSMYLSLRDSLFAQHVDMLPCYRPH